MHCSKSSIIGWYIRKQAIPWLHVCNGRQIYKKKDAWMTHASTNHILKWCTTCFYIFFFCIINTKWIFRNGRGKKEKFLLRCFATSIGASIQRLIRAHLHFIYAFFFHYFIHLNLRIWKNRRNIYNYTLARAVSHTKKQKHILAGSIVMYTFCSVHGNTHTSVLLIALFNKNAHMFLIPICSSAGWLLRMFSDVYEVSTPFAVCVCVFCGAHDVC